ncbi:MAG: hypothetical protein ACI8V5_004399, partial [Limisphaerales bacterium]
GLPCAGRGGAAVARQGDESAPVAEQLGLCHRRSSREIPALPAGRSARRQPQAPACCAARRGATTSPTACCRPTATSGGPRFATSTLGFGWFCRACRREGARAGWIGEVSGGKLSCPSRARRLPNPPLPAPEKPGKIRGDGAWPVSRKAESHASSGACGLREQARSVHNQIEWSNRGSSGSGGEALKG